jgi:CubicO group peptidase (beta-lactamase class C family)
MGMSGTLVAMPDLSKWFRQAEVRYRAFVLSLPAAPMKQTPSFHDFRTRRIIPNSLARLVHRLLVPIFLLMSQTGAAKDNLQGLVEEAMAGTDTPALATLVMRNGKIVDQAVHGVRRNDRPALAASDDAWLLGSTSKVMTVALVARLVEQGTLSWDASLESMLPELATTMRPEYRNTTLTALLSHRAGLPENARDHAFVESFFVDTRPLTTQRAAYVSRALQDAPETPPGSAFGYSNTGFLIAAAIAERVAKTSFEDLMRREVFRPLGMLSAGFGPPPDGQPVGHRGGKPVTKAMVHFDDGVPMAFSPAGNMHMSLHDWALFCLDQMAGSHGRGRLLSPASYRLMQTAQPDSPSGLDWGVQKSIAGRQGPVLVHGGSDGNSLAWVVLFPQSESGILVVANGAEDMGGDKATRAVLGSQFPGFSTEAVK